MFGVAASYINLQQHGSRIESLLPPLNQADKVDASRKSIELLVAMAALTRSDRVDLEDPQNSSNGPANPDIIVHHRGNKFGIACKSLTTQSRQTFKERIEDGLRQIDRAVADGTVDNRRGIVLLDISPLIDHQSLYLPADPEYIAWMPAGVGPIIQSSMQKALVQVVGAPDVTLEQLAGDELKTKGQQIKPLRAHLCPQSAHLRYRRGNEAHLGQGYAVHDGWRPFLGEGLLGRTQQGPALSMIAPASIINRLPPTTRHLRRHHPLT